MISGYHRAAYPSWWDAGVMAPLNEYPLFNFAADESGLGQGYWCRHGDYSIFLRTERQRLIEIMSRNFRLKGQWETLWHYERDLALSPQEGMRLIENLLMEVLL